MAPSLLGVELHIAKRPEEIRQLVQLAPTHSVHICQGVRANGLIGLAQIELTQRSLRQWVVMETVDDSGWRGVLKRAEYRRIFRAHSKSLQGVLATGHRTANWIVARGMLVDRVYPFAYFLPHKLTEALISSRDSGPFRFLLQDN